MGAVATDDTELENKINDVFQLYDRKRDGTCDERDICILIRALGLNPTHEDADRLLEEMRGDDPSSFVKRDKFAAVMLRVLKSQSLKDSEVPKDSEETILRAFQALDPEGRGFIGPEALREFMTVKARMPFNAEEFEAMLNNALDEDKAYIDYEDYAEVLAKTDL